MNSNRKCMVCGNASRPYFSKNFEGQCGLSSVYYKHCIECGFTWSDTHFSMSSDDWISVNEHYHQNYFNTEYNVDDPRWLVRLEAQRQLLVLLSQGGFFDLRLPAVDYGCGDGKLADMLSGSGLPVRKYDKFLGQERLEYLRDSDLLRESFGLVINTSVFEHVRDIETLDIIAGCVNPDSGVLACHTLVSEQVPKDPNWFYLLPVHVAFFTNRSMSILMQRWGFSASIYDVEARMWLMFRQVADARRACQAACIAGRNAHFSIGFMDWWK
jgi:hypothetical protein